MLPENSSNKSKTCRYEIRNILRVSFNVLIYYVRKCDDLYIREDVSLDSDKNKLDSDKNKKKI